MPVPEGQITGSDIWKPKQFRITAYYKVRYVTEVTAETAAEAEGKLLEQMKAFESTNADVLISDYRSEVEEI